MTIAVHQLDLACTLVDGDLHEVQARVIDSRNGMDDHMVGRCMIADTKLSVDAKWGQVAECPDTLTVVGSERRLTLEGDRLREVDEMEVVDRYELHARQLCDFAQAISSGGRPEVALSDARKTLSIVFAMYHAAGIPQDEQVL